MPCSSLRMMISELEIFGCKQQKQMLPKQRKKKGREREFLFFFLFFGGGTWDGLQYPWKITQEREQPSSKDPACRKASALVRVQVLEEVSCAQESKSIGAQPMSARGSQSTLMMAH